MRQMYLNGNKLSTLNRTIEYLDLISGTFKMCYTLKPVILKETIS